MTDIREVATFKSARFVPILPDACQLEPRIYGAELAFWLAGKLARQGVVTSYPVAGESAWVLEHPSAEVLCVNAGGSDTHWRIALATPHGEVQALVNAIRFVLYAAVPSTDIDWRYDNEDCRTCKQMPRM